jgi:CS domain
VVRRRVCGQGLRRVRGSWQGPGTALCSRWVWRRFSRSHCVADAVSVGRGRNFLAAGTVQVEKDQVECEFSERSLELKIRRVAALDDRNFRLHLPKLNDKINPETTAYRVLPKRIIVTMKKEDEDKKWYDLSYKVKG